MWFKNVKFASLLTKVDPATPQEFYLIPLHTFMLLPIHPIHPAPPLAKSGSAFILPLHYPKVGLQH